ncbi:hypothetical protein Pelo_2775 [Pelomyxa schiedti]|nr:hypothetical protein Pelo_2775 [Pelomyxa schiedti]
MLKWLVHTFDLIHFAESNRAAEYFKASDSVHDLKRLVESFPEWQPWFDGKHLALSAGLFKGSATADEIIEVCQWLKDHFSLSGLDFMNWLGMPKHTKVIKWALSDIPASELGGPWSWSCCQLGDVELAKWFIEEKGIIPTDSEFIFACTSPNSEFIFACTSPSDNLGFVQWLFKKVSTSSAELLMALKMALACGNDLISKWLEQCYVATTGTRPKLALAELAEISEEMCQHRREDWLDWLFGHSSLCDIDHSEAELVKLMNQSVHSSSPFQLHVAVSAWKKFPLLSPTTHHEWLVDLLHAVLLNGSLAQAKQVVSLGEFSPTEMQECMSHYYDPYSSKVGKWLVQQCCFSDPHAELTVKNFPSYCGLFVASIRLNKRGFVKWLFNTFHFTLREVLYGMQGPELGSNVDLATWKLLLRLFPSEITRDVLITQPNLMLIATATPLHTDVTMSRVPGVTTDDIEQFYSTLAYYWRID